jgi:hypothetical protein
MADQQPVVHIAENSREYIALVLMNRIFEAEQKQTTRLSREEILRTYAQCLTVVATARFP